MAQLTIGELIEQLEMFDPMIPVVIARDDPEFGVTDYDRPQMHAVQLANELRRGGATDTVTGVFKPNNPTIRTYLVLG